MARYNKILISSSHGVITYDPMPIILLLSNSMNLIGCIEVIYRVYCKKCRNRSLPLDSKFSLYFATSNALFATMQIIDTALSVTHTIKPGVACDITGKLSPSFLTLNLLSTLSFTYLIYLKVCKNIDINKKTGKYDWKLWKTLFLISWVASIFGLNKYEPLNLWCANRPQKGIAYLINIEFIIGMLLATLSIYLKLLNKDEDHMSEIRIVEKYVPVHPRVIRNAVSYLSIFFLQWICVLMYNLSMLYRINDELTKSYFTALLILGVNFGGFGNALMYIMNEYGTYVIKENSSIEEVHGNNTSYGSLIVV